MKYVVVILDGASGWPLDELGCRTTLEVAPTPNLDAMAREGQLGLAQTVPFGSEPSSSAACTSILGYDPVADHAGRGAIEAASMGIELAEGDVALRCNLVTLSDGRMASYSSGHIATEDSHAIAAELSAALDDDTFRIHPGVAYRHILVVHGGHRELMDVEYTPPHDIPEQPVAGYLPRGEGAHLLLEYMERARPVLASSRVNARRVVDGKLQATDVWLFWPGVTPAGMIPFAERRGVSAALTSGVDLMNGLAVLFGIERLRIAGVTDGPDNDYVLQAEGALAALADHDLVIVHVESPDEAGHAGNVAAKVAAIEAIDRDILSRILAHQGDTRVLAMPDHPTPITLKTHVGEPVPFVLWGPGIEPNGGSAFSEVDAGRTGLVLDPGRAVMDALLG